jgi:cell division protease FtsH
MFKNFRKASILIWAVIILAIVTFANIFKLDSAKAETEVIFSEFLSKIRLNQINQVKIRGNEIIGNFTNDAGAGKFRTYGVLYPDLIKELRDYNVSIEILPLSSKMGSALSILVSLAPIVVLSLFWFFITRQMQNTGGKAFGFAKSKAKLQMNKKTKVTFDDVAGIDEAKEELYELVDFLKDPIKFHRLGGNIPKGCLLTGAPGLGKTLLAKAIAGEANVPFFSISGSDFVEMFVGIGASRVRDMFEQGKKYAPCIIFIDEIDAVGRSRGIGMGAGHEEREQTLNQLLVEMDGFTANEGVIIIGATNRPDVLDSALLRPGRFDRQIVISYPDINGRESILKVHLKKVKYINGLDIRLIARGTPGFSGADLANLVNEGALMAAKRGKEAIDLKDIEDAKDKVMMGVERRSVIISDEQKKLTAYHESGHAIVSLYVKDSDPIHKITIVPRGKALGMLVRLPEDDKLLENKQKIESDIRVAMGGRVAEEIIFGKHKITSGASSDIKVATKYAKAMVMHWGMSEKVGNVFHDSQDPYMMYGGRAEGMYSEYTAKLIDQEVKKIIDDAYEDAKKILNTRIDQLHLVAQTLIEKETLTGVEVRDLIQASEKNKKGVTLDEPIEKQENVLQT